MANVAIIIWMYFISSVFLIWTDRPVRSGDYNFVVEAEGQRSRKHTQGHDETRNA
jgi:hypothetical protein